MKSGSEDSPLGGDDQADDRDETQVEARTGSGSTTPGVEADRDAVQSPDDDEMSYLLRRKMSDGTIKFERPERLTLFVHEDVADRETSLIASVQADVSPTAHDTDVREAMYRVALKHQSEVVEELVEMGWGHDE